MLPATLIVSLLAGCIAIDDGESDSGPTIEEAAWIGAGVDAPTFDLVGGELRVGADTVLPVHENEDNWLGFADRAARNRLAHPSGAFRRDGGHRAPRRCRGGDRRVLPDEMEALFGPRPDGLDDGVPRAEVAANAGGELADVTDGVEPVVGPVTREVLAPIRG